MNERYDLILNMKNVRNVAFVAGFGFTCGKIVAGALSDVYTGTVRGMLKFFAKNGNKTAQRCCDEIKLTWEDKKTNRDQEIKDKVVGFRV